MIRVLRDFIRKLSGPTWAERSAPLRRKIAEAKRRHDTRAEHHAIGELRLALHAELNTARGWRGKR